MNPALQRIVNQSLAQEGAGIVSPSFHANNTVSLPDAARESSAFFAARMLGHPYHDRLAELDIPENGATTKVHFRVGGRKDANGNPLPSSIFMVKPYYENLWDWSFGDLPITGWAEMAYQGILRAGGLEHAAMRMHTFPYGGTNLLGIELEPNLHPVAVSLPPEFEQKPWNPQHEEGRVEFPSGVKDDAAKIAALDFLLNNQDRNPYNLLMRVGRDGKAESILAIDNGLSMQYKKSAQWAPYENRDNLFYYFKAPGMNPIFKNEYDGALKAISGWWKQYKPAIVKEFVHHAQAIHHPGVSNHVLSSFNDRVSALDTAVEDFDVHGHEPYQDYMKGHVDDQNKKLFHRAGVAVRDLPAAPDTREPCPTCGESY